MGPAAAVSTVSTTIRRRLGESSVTARRCIAGVVKRR